MKKSVRKEYGLNKLGGTQETWARRGGVPQIATPTRIDHRIPYKRAGPMIRQEGFRSSGEENTSYSVVLCNTGQ